jgi:hypothetical protein
MTMRFNHALAKLTLHGFSTEQAANLLAKQVFGVGVEEMVKGSPTIGLWGKVIMRYPDGLRG